MLLKNINTNYTAKLTGVPLYNVSCNLDLLGAQVVFHLFKVEGLQTESGFLKKRSSASRLCCVHGWFRMKAPAAGKARDCRVVKVTQTSKPS